MKILKTAHSMLTRHWITSISKAIAVSFSWGIAWAPSNRLSTRARDNVWMWSASFLAPRRNNSTPSTFPGSRVFSKPSKRLKPWWLKAGVENYCLSPWAPRQESLARVHTWINMAETIATIVVPTLNGLAVPCSPSSAAPNPSFFTNTRKSWSMQLVQTQLLNSLIDVIIFTIGTRQRLSKSSFNGWRSSTVDIGRKEYQYLMNHHSWRILPAALVVIASSFFWSL